MKNSLKLLSILTSLFVLTSCSKPMKWEYKTIYFDSERFEGKDKGYTKGDDIFKNTVSSATIIPSETSLNDLGKDGWEIIDDKRSRVKNIRPYTEEELKGETGAGLARTPLLLAQSASTCGFMAGRESFWRRCFSSSTFGVIACASTASL